MTAADARERGSDDRRFPEAWWLVAAGVMLLVAVVMLGAELKSDVGPTRPDAAAARDLGQQETVSRDTRSKFQRVADVGSEIPVLISVALLATWAATRRDWWAVAVALVAPATALFVTEYVLKPLVNRRAPNGALSYPSGHAAIVAALVTTALLFVYRYVGARYALLFSPYAIAVVGAVAFAVVALRWHYVSDSVGGVGLGVGVVFVVAAVADGAASGRRRRRTAAGARVL